jgi:hypothetical protein
VLSAAGTPAPSISVITSDFAVAIAVACAVDTGLFASAVLSTFARPTEDFVSAATAVEIAVPDAVPASAIASDLAVAIAVA